MTNWEYYVINFPVDDLGAQLDALGLEGWEAAVMDDYMIILKRALPAGP